MLVPCDDLVELTRLTHRSDKILYGARTEHWKATTSKLATDHAMIRAPTVLAVILWVFHGDRLWMKTSTVNLDSNRLMM